MSSTNPSIDSTLQLLRDVRRTILRLHKALLDFEKIEYEIVHGKIRNSSEFLQLVIGDEWFNWLHPISQYIVQVDEVLYSKEPIAEAQIHSLLEQARSLLQPNQEGTILEQRYDYAIQREPAIALMHIEISRLLHQ
ncbi:hypothetical protein [Calothrix sp. NIES-3974]|uniref:hypothetical protein n=1 Tax=Calothrix sp. NIES-3974 TaxID=2005462 RepID=UPI000B5ED329|nr:hypothetical protein [Calothrix sp. NIES-3974]BAZ05429.1 hypothetical protein NIES3974_20770 [Calothrix sp. NIES-3974]